MMMSKAAHQRRRRAGPSRPVGLLERVLDRACHQIEQHAASVVLHYLDVQIQTVIPIDACRGADKTPLSGRRCLAGCVGGARTRRSRVQKEPSDAGAALAWPCAEAPAVAVRFELIRISFRVWAVEPLELILHSQAKRQTASSFPCMLVSQRIGSRQVLPAPARGRAGRRTASGQSSSGQ
eukprot:COSAG04_NODE_3611_length_2674_cov_1.328544_2_plen_180_part_00